MQSSLPCTNSPKSATIFRPKTSQINARDWIKRGTNEPTYIQKIEVKGAKKQVIIKPKMGPKQVKEDFGGPN